MRKLLLLVPISLLLLGVPLPGKGKITLFYFLSHFNFNSCGTENWNNKFIGNFKN